MTVVQLPLAVQLHDQTTFTDFCWNGNELLQQQIEHSLTGAGERLLYLWGVAGSGKSHLLQACCQVIDQHQSAMYLPLKDLKEFGPGVLEELDGQAWIGIDDVDVVAGHLDWEEALFHLYNRVRDNLETGLVITGHVPPANLSIRLPDLRSRLSWGLVMQMNVLKDKDKVTIMMQHAKRRGFSLSESVAQFLINRCARNMHELDAILNRLDEASLIAQRKITIPFVKQVFGL